jgi:hypothetical protein
MKPFKLMVVALVSMVFLASAQAEEREFADIYTDCGLGAIIAPKNDAVAAVTNVTWDSGTTAISSHASSEGACKGGKAESMAFIFDTYPSLEIDLAQGAGEHLTSLLTIAGCANGAHSDIAASLRGDFGDLLSDPRYSSQSPYQQAEGLANAFSSRITADFASTCSLM